MGHSGCEARLWNTLVIAVSKVILNIIIPMAFALMLNEVRTKSQEHEVQKGVQTIVYLPHFISWVLLGNIITNMLGTSGILNTVLKALGQPTVMPMTEPSTFQGLLVGTDVWKEFGYNAVIYLAALTGIDLSLYEAAAIDGANRWQSTWHITLPGLVPTVVLLTTLAMGNVLNAGFDQVFNMYNNIVLETADIIDTYVYRLGLVRLQFSMSTAPRPLQVGGQLYPGRHLVRARVQVRGLHPFSERGAILL